MSAAKSPGARLAAEHGVMLNPTGQGLKDRLAAEQAGATSEVEEIKKQLEKLP